MRRSISLSAVASGILLGAMPLQAERQGDPALPDLQQGLAAYEATRFEAATEKFTQALAKRPGYKTAAAFRSLCRWTMGDAEGATRDAQLGIKLRPNDAQSFTARGFAHFVLKDFIRAEEDFLRAIKADASYVPAYFALGSALSSQERPREALPHLDLAVRLNPKSAIARIVRGTVQEKLQDYDKAIADYSQALELAPDFFWARYYRGRTYRQLRQYEQAIQDFTAFLEQHPNFIDALYMRSNAYFLSKEYAKAAQDLSFVLALDPQNGLAYANRALARVELGDRTGALLDLRKAQGLAPPGKKERIQSEIDRLIRSSEEEASGQEPSGIAAKPLSSAELPPQASSKTRRGPTDPFQELSPDE